LCRGPTLVRSSDRY